MIKTENLVKDCFSRILNNNDGNQNGANKPFKLDKDFLSGFHGQKPQFGFGGLGEFVFYRTYSRLKPDGSKESFADVLQRVTEGVYEIQRQHCYKQHVPWTRSKAQVSAQEMFQRMWDFKFLPPGRGLWMMGTEFMWERGGAALQNCGYISTENIDKDLAEPFHFVIDMAMLGVGVGFDTRGAGKVVICPPKEFDTTFTVSDSRESWADSTKVLIESYTDRSRFGRVEFDYSQVRPAGTPIKGFGGEASGPGILRELHESLRGLFDSILQRKDHHFTSVDIVDAMNLIGRCIVAGNVRRVALLALGDGCDDEYCNIKNYLRGLTDYEAKRFKEVADSLCAKSVIFATVKDFEGCNINHDLLKRSIEVWNACNNHRWTSNNAIFARVGMDYSDMAKRTAVNGEPSYIWLDNIQNYGRFIDGKQATSDKATGVNPCAEMALESHELCTLCETFPSRHDNVEDYYRTLKFAYLYAKTTTLLPTHNAKTNSIMLRNRRIGLSQSGIVEAFKIFGRRTVLRDFCDNGYKVVRSWDNIYSDWLCCPKSNKVTTVKPSGSLSLVVGVFAGIHYSLAPSRSYWRRVRISANSSMIKSLVDAGYDIEQAINDPGTVIVKFGINSYTKTISEVSIWEQVKNSVDYQRFWSDNSVSTTIQFKKEEAHQIVGVLEAFDAELKAISFLPIEDHGYAQPPYEQATKKEVDEYNSRLKDIDFMGLDEDAIGEKLCSNDVCQVY